MKSFIYLLLEYVRYIRTYVRTHVRTVLSTLPYRSSIHGPNITMFYRPWAPHSRSPWSPIQQHSSTMRHQSSSSRPCHDTQNFNTGVTASCVYVRTVQAQLVRPHNRHTQSTTHMAYNNMPYRYSEYIPVYCTYRQRERSKDRSTTRIVPVDLWLPGDLPVWHSWLSSH